jgi:hypothetical protein
MVLFSPEQLPLPVALGTLCVLALTNAVEVRRSIALRLSASPVSLFVAALPGRTTLFMLCALFGSLMGSGMQVSISSVLGLSFIGAAMGYIANIPFLVFTTQRAWVAVGCLRAEAQAAFEDGAVQACAELDSERTDQRTWSFCFREANEDTEIAGHYYMRRRGRELAKMKLLAGGKWTPWIPTSMVQTMFKALLGGRDDHAPSGTQPPMAPPRAHPACDCVKQPIL